MIEQLKREIDRAAGVAGEAKAQAVKTAEDLTETENRLTSQITDLRKHTDAKLRVLTLDGLPLAIVGLCITVGGTGIQWLALFW